MKTNSRCLVGSWVGLDQFCQVSEFECLMHTPNHGLHMLNMMLLPNCSKIENVMNLLDLPGQELGNKHQ